MKIFFVFQGWISNSIYSDRKHYALKFARWLNNSGQEKGCAFLITLGELCRENWWNIPPKITVSHLVHLSVLFQPSIAFELFYKDICRKLILMQITFVHRNASKFRAIQLVIMPWKDSFAYFHKCVSQFWLTYVNEVNILLVIRSF